MSALAAARSIHAANQKDVVELLTKLKVARAALKVSGDLVAKEAAKAMKEKISTTLPKPTVKPKVTVGKLSVKKAAVCKPYVPVKRGRPSDGSCNACKRLLLGKKGGKPHTCGRIPYSRIG